MKNAGQQKPIISIIQQNKNKGFVNYFSKPLVEVFKKLIFPSNLSFWAIYSTSIIAFNFFC